MLYSNSIVLKCFLLLVFVLPAAHVSSNEYYDEVLELTNQGNLQQAEYLARLQLAKDRLSRTDEIHYLAILGDIFFYRDDFVSANEYFQQALSLARKTNNNEQIAEQCKNIAISHSELGEYGEALRWHQLSWETLIENGWQESETAISILLAQSSIYGNIGAYEQSMETVTKAQKLASKLGKLDALSDSYLRIAAIQIKNSNNQAALNSLQLVDTNVMNDRSSLSWYFNMYADVLLKLNKIPQAQMLINKALNYQIKWTDENITAFEITLLESYLLTKNLTEANLSLQALEKNHNNFKNSWVIHFLLAKKYKIEKKHKQSFETNLKAISLFFQYSSFNHHSNNSLFFTIPQELIEATIVDAMDVGLAHSELLFELFYLAFLAKEPIQVKTGVNNNIDTAIYHQAESSVIKDIMFGEVSLNFTDRLKLSELQKELLQDEAYIFYLTIGENFYVMMVTSAKITSLKFQNQATNIENMVIQLLAQLEANSDDWMKTAHKLDGLLIKPLRQAGLEHMRTLHFIQDGNLRFLPMDVLIDDQGILLSDRHDLAINTVKSLKRHLNLNKNRTKIGHLSRDIELNLIGASDGKIEIPSFWHTAYRNLNLSNNKLPNVNRELQHLYSQFSNSFLTMGKTATETRAKQIINNATGILHFASHGFDNPIAPAYSAVILKADANNDGLLQAREISKLSTQSSLVVLASCSSAKGGLNGLYGYNSGLAESFLYAGAKTVIGSLWDVKDEQTYQLMQWFYQGLSHHLTVSDALNFAKKKARQSAWKTHDWSAFVLLGKTDLKFNIKRKNSLHMFLYILFATALLVIIIFYIRKHKWNIQ